MPFIPNAQIAAATGSLTRLQQLSGGSGVMSFTSIDQSYGNLLIVLFARGDTAATSTGVFVTFNNDSGSNYDDQRLVAVGGSGATTGETQAQAFMNLVSMPAANAPANVYGQVWYQIAGYSDTTSRKSILAQGLVKTADAGSGLALDSGAGFYRTAGAVTRVDLTAQAGNFTAASRATLYGLT